MLRRPLSQEYNESFVYIFMYINTHIYTYIVIRLSVFWNWNDVPIWTLGVKSKSSGWMPGASVEGTLSYPEGSNTYCVPKENKEWILKKTGEKHWWCSACLHFTIKIRLFCLKEHDKAICTQAISKPSSWVSAYSNGFRLTLMFCNVLISCLYNKHKIVYKNEERFQQPCAIICNFVAYLPNVTALRNLLKNILLKAETLVILHSLE